MKLYDYQIPHADTLLAALQKHGAAKDGSDCGTGKTPVAAHVAAKLGTPAMVVCPKILIPTWERWMREAGVEHWHVANYEKLRTGNHPYVDRGKKGRTEYFVWKLRKDTLLIWDEDHALAGQGTLNSRLCIAASAQGYRQLFLGATSVDGPHKLHAMGQALGLHAGANFKEWALSMGCFKDTFRNLSFTGGAKYLDDLHELLYGGATPRGSRMRIAELGDRFPMNTVTADLYTVDNADQIEKCYTELAEQLEALDEKEADDHDSELVLRLRARQRVELYKVPLFVDLIKQHRREGVSVPVFVSFRDTVFALSEKLTAANIKHGVVTGVRDALETRLREEAIEDFQANRTKVILCIDSAGGVGIDLDDQLGTAPRVPLINPSDSATIFKQVLGRCHRAGSKTPVVQKIVCAQETADEVVYRNLIRKIDRISRINDADLDPLFDRARKI